MLYSISKPFAKIALGIYFRKLYISNIDNLPKDKPVLLVANHPTAFIEPIILVCWLTRKLSFLARGDLYMNNPLIRKLYDWYHMTPVFRLEDAGYSNLKNNYDTFSLCYDALRDQRVIMILAEGRTIHEKRLRPIMKGSARIVFGALEKYKDLDIHVVPVGVNYSNSDAFRSVVMIDVGKPILASDYKETYEASPAKAVTSMTREISKRLKERVIHIDKKADDDLVEHLLVMAENDADPKFPRAFSPDEKLLFQEKQLADRVNEMEEEGKTAFRNRVEAYVQKLKGIGASDLGLVKRDMNAFPNYLFLILGWLPQMTGKIWNAPPLLLGNFIAKKIAPAIEFRAAVSGVFSTILWILGLILQGVLIYSFGEKWMLGLLVLMPVLGYFHLIYRDLSRKFIAALRAKKIDQATLDELLRMRKEILEPK